MGTMLQTLLLNLAAGEGQSQRKPDILDRIDQCNTMLKKAEARSSLLGWASSVVGLPISHVSQVQNGAVFCYMISVLCPDAKIDVSQVKFLAITEVEYSCNFQMIQAVARSGQIRGLNKDAKLRDWLHLATSRSDAWAFLDLLQKCFNKAGLKDHAVDIECDATPPPPPLKARRDRRDVLSSQSSAELNWSFRNECSRKDDSRIIPDSPVPPPDVGSLVLNLADAWTKLAHNLDADETMNGVRLQPKSKAQAKDAMLPFNDSTKRAHAYLRSLLDSGESRQSTSENESQISTRSSQDSFSGRSSCSEMCIISKGSYFTPGKLSY